MSSWLSQPTIEVSFRNRGKAVAFLIAACVLATILAVANVREAGSQTLGESLRPAWIEAGLRLDAGQPALYHRLGMLRFYSTDHPDAAGGLELLRRATKMAPGAAPYWRDLASACAAVSDTPCAEHAFRRAAALNPMAPGLHWIVANYDLGLNRTGDALAEFRRLLEMDPEYAGAVFHLCLRMFPDEALVWNKVVEGNRNFKIGLAWVNALAGDGRLDDAYRAWREEMANLQSPQAVGNDVSYGDASALIDALIEHGLGREAEVVWSDLCRFRVVQEAGASDSQTDLVFNGDFERKPLNSGLDWRLNPSPNIMIRRENRGGPAGDTVLRIDFTPPENAADEPVCQYVPVQPSHAYVLSAQVSSEGITSDRGPQLRVTDPFTSKSILASTADVTGTNPWHRISVTFSTGPQTDLVKISVWRKPSRAFPFEISGTFWLGSVSLKPVHSQPGSVLSAAKPEFSLMPPNREGPP